MGSVFINGTGRPCCSRSLRSEAGSELGAAPLEKEAEFPAVCSGGRGLLTPRNPEKYAAGSGGLTVSSVGSGRFLSYRGDLGAGDFFSIRGGRTANRAKKRHKAGVSHQLPAWPGTTITSSSCSSSVTAVSRRRGCGTGSGPCLVFFQGEREKRSCSPALYLYVAFTTCYI